MSQMVTRKSVAGEDKDKERESPPKDTKKKMAANSEKEKQAAENVDKNSDKGDKNVEKRDQEAAKSAEKKADKPADKKAEKPADKKTDKPADKPADKKPDRKSDTPTEKPKEDNKVEKSGKEKNEKEKEAETKPIENGRDVKHNGKPHNGVTDVTLSNGGTDDMMNGTVSEESDDNDDGMIIDDDKDELFPELTYDDTSDVECFESPTPENLPSRSFTRRSQAKVTRTPETPRPTSEKQPDKDGNTDDSKEGKPLKLKEDVLSTDRKLRSADSPKPGDKKTLEKPQESGKKLKEKTPEPTRKAQDSPKKSHESPKKAQTEDSKDGEKREKENGEKEIEIDVEMVDSDGSQDEPRKLDTNYSKSRVKVSPYRRSMRLADQTTSSVMANYTGNNTTMEMDITETSSYVSINEDPSLDDSSYLGGLRSIRGRRSYKPLKEMALRHVLANRSTRSAQLNLAEIPSRPTGTVVGRKRKPDGDETVEKAEIASESDDLANVIRSKRMRLLDRISQPFKRTIASTPIPRRPAEIVGINTDLPLTAPVDPETFDPESLKTSPIVPEVTKTAELTQATERDGKRCIIM